MFSKWWLLVVPLVVVFLPVVWLLVQAQLAQRPKDLGPRDGKLRPCPDSPNCVSTQSGSTQHQMEPLPLLVPADEAMEGLREVVESMPQSVVVERGGRYLHAEFTSAMFAFVDDVEFLIEPSERSVHFRSGSRVGYSDLGANRARMERIGDLFASWQANRRDGSPAADRNAADDNADSDNGEGAGR